MPDGNDSDSQPDDSNLSLAERKFALKKRQLEYDIGKEKVTNPAVLITFIAGLAAITVQIASLFTSWINSRNEMSKTEYDQKFRGLELFIKNEDTIITCNINKTSRNLEIFQKLYPEFSDQFSSIAREKAPECAAIKNNETVIPSASEKNNKQDAQAAFYKTLAQQTSVIPQPSTSDPAHPTIYLQISDESQRVDAQNLQMTLSALEYKIPGIQRVNAAPNVAQVRYYYSGQRDVSKLVAKQIAHILSSPVPEVDPVPGKYGTLPTGVIEYWFPNLKK